MGECADDCVSLQSKAAAFQAEILLKVSRTFALTIPQLPPDLCRAVSNAYLLCRIADTIEDEPALTVAQKYHYEAAFVDVVTGQRDAGAFANEVAPLLSAQTLEAERELLKQLPQVLHITATLRPAQRAAIVRCLKVMSRGMVEFQRNASLSGLATLHDLDCYCYCVAGVVGEMLTALIIDFAPDLISQRNLMLPMSVSFGHGLQITNILKDQWEDRDRGISWLPQDMFAGQEVHLATLSAGQKGANYAMVMTRLIGIAHAHLRQALEFALQIPAKHAGIRRFILWATGLALLTLRNLNEKPHFSSGTQVKVSRKEVARIIKFTTLFEKNDLGLRRLFAVATRKLPFTPLTAEWCAPYRPAFPWPKRAIPYLSDIGQCEG